MKKNKAEKILAEAVSATTPDVIDSILSRCESKGGEVITMNQIKNESNDSRKSRRWVRKVIAGAAAVALIIGCSLGFGSYQKAHAAETVVSVDAGSAVSVGVNDEDVVVSVFDNSGNVEKSDVKGMKVSDAVCTIASKMVGNGSISKNNNVILVSVQDASNKVGDEFNDEITDEINEELEDAKKEVEEELADAIQEVLDEHGIQATVIGQRFAEDEAIEEIAREFSISSGKASFIQKVLSANENEDGTQFKDLAKKSIKDIIKYAAKWLSNIGVSVSADDDVSVTVGAGDATEGSSAIGGTAKGSGDVSVSVGKDANVNVDSGANGSFRTHVDADNGDVKVDVETGDKFSLGVEVDGEKFTYDSSDPGGSMVGIIESIIKAS